MFPQRNAKPLGISLVTSQQSFQSIRHDVTYSITAKTRIWWVSTAMIRYFLVWNTIYRTVRDLHDWFFRYQGLCLLLRQRCPCWKSLHWLASTQNSVFQHLLISRRYYVMAHEMAHVHTPYHDEHHELLFQALATRYLTELHNLPDVRELFKCTSHWLHYYCTVFLGGVPEDNVLDPSTYEFLVGVGFTLTLPFYPNLCACTSVGTHHE